MKTKPTQQNIHILGEDIALGKSALLSMDIAKLHTRTRIEVPVIVERAKTDGPVLLVTGGIHGDEINGVEVVRQFIAKKYNKPQIGTVICIPVVNVFGFLNLERQFPDGRDLNRMFPGNQRGSLAGQFAYHLMKEIVPLVDYCLDFHTGGADRFNAPQIRINAGDEETLKLARVFNAPFILLSKNREKSFRDSAIKLGKKVLLYEGGKSLSIDEGVTTCGVTGILNVMAFLGMRAPLATNQTSSVIIEKSKWVRASCSGMFRTHAKLGKFYQKGEVLGSISDPFGQFERKVKAPKAGFVFCINETPIVNKGDAVFHLTDAVED